MCAYTWWEENICTIKQYVKIRSLSYIMHEGSLNEQNNLTMISIEAFKHCISPGTYRLLHETTKDITCNTC